MSKLLPLLTILALFAAAVLFAGAPVEAQSGGNLVEVTVSFGEAEYTVNEGESVQIPVRLSRDPQRTVVIPITTTAAFGAGAEDYSVPASVTFNAGSRQQTLTFAATQDTLNDDGEAVLVKFGSILPNGVTRGNTDSTEVYIGDDDIPDVVLVSFGVYSEFVQEGETNSVFVTLNEDPGRELVIPITVTHLGGASSADYSALPASLTFGRNENTPTVQYSRSRKFDFVAARDNVDDDGEAVRISFGEPLPAGVRMEEPAQSIVRLLDGGQVSVGSAQVGIGVSADLYEEDEVYCRVDERMCEEVLTSNEAWQWQRSATEFGTYSDIPAADGGTSNPYTPTEEDLGKWLKAKVTYDLGSITGRTAQGTTQQPVLWRPAVSSAGYAHKDDEGFNFTMSLPVTHRYAQRFTTGNDPRGYLLVGTRVILYQHGGTPAGTWGVHADIGGKPAVNPLMAARSLPNIDSAPDTYEELTHPTGVPLDSGTKYWIVISQTTPSDDGNISVGSWSGFGGLYDELLLTEKFSALELSPDPAEETGPSPIPAGSEDGWSIDFQALTYYYDDPDDSTDDPSETCEDGSVDPDDVVYGNACQDVLALLPWRLLAHAMQLPSPMVLRMSVLVAPDVTVEFGAADYTADEGGAASVEVTLSGDPRRTITVPIAATGAGGATAADFEVPASVTFNAGETSKTITFTAVDDHLDDDDESVTLAFGTMPDAWIARGTQDETTVAIVDDDDPRVTVTFGQHSYSVAEGATQEVTVTLSADPERELIIPIVGTDQGGATVADYGTLPANLTFASGETSKSFTFTATDDAVDDDDESVLLEFGTMPDERVTIGLHAEATVEIVDDDDPEVTVEFGQDSQTADEGETVNVTVRLSADPERMVSIPLTSAPQGTASAADYVVPTTVTFSSGQTETTFTFMAVDDEEDDDDEKVKLGFGSPLPPRVTLGTRTETTLKIGDDDDPDVTVQFSQSALSVAEGATQQVTVSVDKDPKRTIIIPLTATLQGTAGAADYSGVPASVTFTDGGALSMSFTFAATQDRIDDDDEKVKLGFGTMPDPRINPGTTDELTMSIDDDDTADIVLSPVSLTLEEEQSAPYTVRLDSEPTVEVTVTIGGHAGTDLDLESGRLVNQALTFTPTNWSTPQAVTVVAAHDDDGVADDATLTHTAAGAEYAGVKRDLPVTVNDNDPLGIVLGPPALTVAESASADYAVSLATEPTVSVTVTITGHAGTDLSISGPDLTSDALTFTAANWRTPQAVTVAAGHDEDREDDVGTLTHTARGGEYELLSEVLPVTVDDNTGDLRLVDGTMTDEEGNPCEGRLEIYYDGEWGTICDDYWTEDDADVACRALGFTGGSVEDWDRFRNSFFPQGQEAQPIWLDDMLCGGGESNLLDCRRVRPVPVGTHNCRHLEDVGLRCLKSTGPWIVGVEFSAPGDGDGTYDAGETVEVRLVWSEPVTLETTPNGYPRVWLSYGGEGEWLYHPTGSGTDRTVYTRTLRARGGATSFPHLGVGYDSLILRNPSLASAVSGSIVSVEAGAPAVVGFRTYRSSEPGATVSGSSMQVEATRTVGVPSFNEPADGVFGRGETVEVTFTFSQAVEVDTTGGTPSVPVLLGGTASRQAPYLRGSGTSQLVFGYTLGAGDGEHGSLLVEPSSLSLNGGSILDGAGTSADLAHQGAGAFFAPPPDVDAPQLQSATVDGSTLTLTYDETLDNSAPLSTGLFAVSVNGAARSVLVVAVGEASVLLFLSAPVESGDTVTVDYAAPTADSEAGLQDPSGNAAASFSGWAVTNGTAAPLNTRAAGAPTIAGTARAGETLTVDTSGISDADGLESAAFTYRWLAHDGSADTVIPGAAGSSYTLRSTDVGKTITARVSFTDDAGHSETLTSAATEEVAASPNTPAAGTPTIAGTARAGETLTVDTSGISDADGLESATFTHRWLAHDGSADTAIPGAAGSSYTLRATDVGKTITVRVSFTDDAGHSETLTSAATAAVAARPNTPAAGTPTIAGTARVGETLTVDTSDISDADGLESAAFTYQWLANDGSADTAIPGAAGSSYTLRATDVGKAITVRVSFTDDAGHSEELTSAATAAVVAAADAPPVWSVEMTVVHYGYGDVGAASPELFSNETGDLDVVWLWYSARTREIQLAFLKPLADAAELRLQLDDISLAFPTHSSSTSFIFTDVDISWTEGQTVAASIVR